MPQWNIRNRLLLSFLILIFVTISLLGSYILWFFQQHNLQLLTDNLFSKAYITEQLLQDHMHSVAGQGIIDGKLKELATKTDLRITVIALDGRVLADSWETAAAMENHLDRPEVATAMSGKRATATRYSTTLQQNSLYVAIPIQQEGAIYGVVRVASTLSHVEAAFHQVSSVILTALLLTSLLAVLISITLARKYSAPLETMTHMARQISNGHLDERIHIRTGDELEILAHTLNNLASNLDDKITEISAEKHKLELILEHMDNAVILLDKYGRVTSANAAAFKTFGITESMLGQHSIQVIGNSLLNQAVQDTATSAQSRMIDLKTQLQGSKKVFQVFLAPIVVSEKESKEILSVFHDITALQEVHDRQADFIANASHELATPLTSIKGFAETLLDGALQNPELSTKFVRIINEEAERMQRLVKDLLQLAKLHSPECRQHIILQPLLLTPLLRQVTQELEPRLAAKELQCSIDSPAQLEILAHADSMKQVLINLLDNSIKYTGNGGSIQLTCRQEQQTAVLTVTDSGIGIPPQDIPFIFDRFYRVDRARTRSAGGIGLGLSIVKFIVELHHGSIEVSSQVNSGTTFTITLPLAPLE